MKGRHTVVPLHASIQESCRRIGFDNLAPIIWHKIANAVYEASGNGGGFLGKPYEPNAVIKNDIEFILMQRKPGGYRSPVLARPVLSLISDANHKEWFQQVWTGVTGASTRGHPAPFPLELAEGLVRMFSFVGDTVLDPFLGSGTTMVAAMQHGRNCIGFEIDGKSTPTGHISERSPQKMCSAKPRFPCMSRIERRVGQAIKLFWSVRDQQSDRQGAESGTKDAGLRAAVTGGKHLDGFTEIFRDLFLEAGVPEAHVYWKQKRRLPGYYRAEKDWDLIVVADGHVLAILEFKAQVGPSFGNNFNNRTEEIARQCNRPLGRLSRSAFRQSGRPWLGYIFILEDCPRLRAPVKVAEPHFRVFEEFRVQATQKRYGIMLTKLLREGLYDGACLMLSTHSGGLKGKYTTPSDELSFATFAGNLEARAIAYAKSSSRASEKNGPKGRK